MYLLDTTVWIDLLRTNSQSIRGKLSEHSKSVIGLSVTKLCTTPPALYQEVSRSISCCCIRKWSGRVDLKHRPPGPEPQKNKSKLLSSLGCPLISFERCEREHCDAYDLFLTSLCVS